MVKNWPTTQETQWRRRGFNPWVGNIPSRRKWQPTPVFLPEKSHWHRSLVGYSLWCHKKSRMQLSTLTSKYKLKQLQIQVLKVKVTQWYPTLWEPWTIVHGMLQARILKWIAFPFCRVSSGPRNQTGVSGIAGGFFTRWTSREILRIQQWVAYPFSSRSSQPRNWTRASSTAGRFFISWATREAPNPSPNNDKYSHM